MIKQAEEAAPRAPVGSSFVAALLFFSGACALVYQVAWFRELRLIFGASTASSAAVLAIFMGGLGLGGARLGKRADASANPLAMYAMLEIGVACMAGATPALVWLADALYIGAGGSAALGVAGASLLRLMLSVVVLGPATFLMGGTLPAAARAIERASDGPRRSVATLYGVNTLGAVSGTLLANFMLLEVLGTRLTLWMAALVNVLVGVVARSIARRSATTTASADNESGRDAGASREAATSDAGDADKADVARWFPPAASALAGASFMLMELTWYRMLAPLLGGSSYTFGLILAVALVGIAIGGVVYARTKVPATLAAFAITCSLEALFIALPYAAGDRLAIVAALLRPLSRVGFGASAAVWVVIASFTVLPAAIVSGVQFPLIIGLYGRGSRRVGRDVGAAYLANTMGSIAGSIAGGFGLIPLLGALGAWKLVVVALCVGATVAAVLDGRARGTRAHVTGSRAALAWLPAALLLAHGPSAVWRHAGIGAGRADAKLEGAGAAAVTAFAKSEARSIRWEADGVESSVALGQLNGFTFIVNGKADGHATGDAPTQVMSGVLSALLHGSPKSALVVGLGTGSTAGWLGVLPPIERVDVVELEPAILRVARDCGPVNENVLDNAKVHVHLADAREYLRTARGRWDIIFSEPSNPFRAGISSLYTLEYYRAAAQRVAPGGIFVQWVQAYEIDGRALATAIVTLRQAFPSVAVWETMSGDLLLVGRAEHRALDIDRMRATLELGPYARAARAVWRTSSPEGVLARFVAQPRLADALAERGLGAVNTDDQNFLEFAFARTLGDRRVVDVDLGKLSRRLETHRPEVVGQVDWDRVLEEQWLSPEAIGAASVQIAAQGESPFAMFVTAFRQGRHAAALKSWKNLRREGRESFAEILLVAESAARAGEPEDAPLIDRAPLPERDVLQATWLARHGDAAGAAAALARAFTAARINPWLPSPLRTAALTMASEIAQTDVRLARALYDALAEPFAVEAGRDDRLMTAAQIAERLPEPGACVAAVSKLEPPLWNRSALELRARCYARAHDARLASAEADLLAFAEHDTPLGASIPTPPKRTQEHGPR